VVIIETDAADDVAMPLITGMICSSVITVTILLVSKKCCKKQKNKEVDNENSDDKEYSLDRVQS